MRGKTVKKSKTVTILNLPDVPFFKILGFSSYNQVANLRPVCKKFNEMCGKQLNHGFQKARAKIRPMLKEIDPLVPKRPSQRYKHKMYKNLSILEDIGNFVEYLGKQIQESADVNLCFCFYPGKILDEMMSLMRQVSTKEPLPSSSSLVLLPDISAEFKDLKTLILNHFYQNFSPKLKKAIELKRSLETSKIEEAKKEKEDKLEKKFNSIENLCKRQSKELTTAKSLFKSETKKLKDLLNKKDDELKELHSKFNKLEELVSKMTSENEQTSTKKKLKRDAQDVGNGDNKKKRKKT